MPIATPCHPERHRSRQLHPSATQLIAYAAVVMSSLAPLAVSIAQGTPEQRQRVADLPRLGAEQVLNETVDLHWFGPDDRYAWYESQRPDRAAARVVIDTRDGTKRPAEECDAYIAHFGKPTGNNQPDDRSNLPPLQEIVRSEGGGSSTEIVIVNQTDKPVRMVWHSADGDRVPYGEVAPGESRSQHTFGGHVWLLTDGEGNPLAAVKARDGGGRFELTPQSPRPAEGKKAERRNRRQRLADKPEGESSLSPESSRHRSPDGRSEIEFRKHNVVLTRFPEAHVKDASNPERTGPDTDPTAETAVRQVLTFDGNAEDRYQPPVWWSPDGNHFCLLKTRLGERREITLIESAPDDQLQPKTIRIDYAKPGDRLDHPRLHLFGRDGRVHHVIDETQAPNPYSVTEVSWHPDGKSVRMLYNQRGHQRLSLLSLDVASGKTRAIIDELSPTFIDYAGKYFLRLLDDRDEAIWMSERSGWNHLYLIRQSTGEVIRPLTAGEFVVREVVRVDPEARTMLVAVGGYYSDQDPYHLHLLRVSLDGGPPMPLTSGDGNHEWEFSPSGKYLVDRYSRVDLPPVTEIRSMETGQSICVVEQADASELERAIGPLPTRFVAKGRDGKTDIWGFIIFPNGHNPAENRRYPVLEMIYAGPHAAHVPKSFGRMVDLRKTADLGFIIVRIDGMGTSHRSKAFHDVCWKNLADSGFPDRIAWMRAAAEKHPSMDLSRVGIWGGSAGGQSAMRALIDHGDFYKAAFADCGCHDNRMDKIWWNELWMGWPIGPHYEDQSNVTGAAKVNGALMLSVGELDRNVDPSSTLQVVNALIRADKDFDLLFVPGKGHGAGGSPYGERRRNEFFLRHLYGPATATPPDGGQNPGGSEKSAD